METWKKYFSIPFCLNAKIDFKNTTSRLELSLAYYNSVLKIYLFSNIPDNFAKARVYPLSCQSFEKTTPNSLQICKNGFHSFLNLFGRSTLNTRCDPSIRKRDMIWPGSSEFSIKYWISPAPPLSDPHILYKPVNKLSAWLQSGILLLLVIKTLLLRLILQHWLSSLLQDF